MVIVILRDIFDDACFKNIAESVGSVAEGVVEGSAQIGWVLGDGGRRNADSRSVHRLEDILFCAFFFSRDLLGWILYILGDLEEAIDSFAVSVGVSPFAFMIADIVFSLLEISLKLK
jgi:hypothetical protein